ncbi:Aste57867_3502 [Aphanomyces stellatus]|uniref:Calmodulin-lysine N-methyltransferase n=1 Tax=Aphanomyces stellatus TaxID=120398 RepID=A0A485KFB5_9STRA|nr:hypothetical protein As57867_003491 [Aphanomyces stellatus]VFT80666.1 Aste57867_3502 [Aphanomyces stellatus]
MEAGQASASTRWARLRSAIRKQTVAMSSTPSTMSMFTFHEAETTALADAPSALADYEWIEAALPRAPHRLYLHQRKAACNVSIQELAIHAVDNTGNIRTWPCEDVLWHTLLHSPSILSNSAPPMRLLEIGAGMCGVAGLALAAQLRTLSHVVLTDGNAACVENLRMTVDVNVARGVVPPALVNVQLLQWSRDLPPRHDDDKFDIVLGSDCLFFESFHVDLVHTLRQLVSATGCVVLLQPSRGGSLERFVALAKTQFDVRLDVDFDAAVSAKHRHFLDNDPTTYVPDIHRPILVTMRPLADVRLEETALAS